MGSLTELLTEAKSLKDDYSEEIPIKIVHGKAKFKVQKNWFNNITSMIQEARQEGIIKDQEVINHYNTFERYMIESGLRGRNIKVEDIQKANEFLNYLINYCEQRVGK